MSAIKVLIEQMVSDISSQAVRLDDLRLSMFLNWLIAHRSKVKAAIRMDIAGLRKSDMEAQFKLALKTWLECLSVQGMLWEYHLILDELTWWCNLDPHRWKMILKSEAGK